jgi:enterochelin esterase-like enzyme
MFLTRRFGFLALLLAILIFCGAGCAASDGAVKTGSASGTGAHTQAGTAAQTPAETVLPSEGLSPSPTAQTRISTSTQGPSGATLPAASATPAGFLRSSPTAAPAETDCSLESGQIITSTLQTSLLRQPLAYRVYLPPCYGAQPKERYPSLYLFHGQSYNDDQWDRMGIDETADRLIAAGKVPPLIIIMPYDRSSSQPTESGFSDTIVKQLIPTIDETYRTKAGREFRAAGGLSRGAGWAIHFGISYWRLFGRVGGHSSAVFHTDAQRMRTWLKEIPAEQYPQVYLDIGDRDRPEIMRSTLWFEDLLNLYDVPHEFHLFSGYHAEAYWSAHLEDYLVWYTKDW